MSTSTIVRYAGDGSTKTFGVPFSYINKNYVKAFVAGVEQTSFVWADAANISFASAPATGAIVEIKRVTPSDTSLIDFSDGSTLTADQLDLVARQCLDVAQEASDYSLSALNYNTSGQYDAKGVRIANVAAPIDANDAANKSWTLGQIDAVYSDISNNAQDAADSAAAAAASAQTAGSVAASSAAAAVVGVANAAAASAASASTSANAAANSATIASAAAESAQIASGAVTRFYATKSDLQTWVGSHTVSPGYTYTANGTAYVGFAGATSVTGLPGLVDLDGSQSSNGWGNGKSAAIVGRSKPRFLMPEMYIGLETQIIYAPTNVGSYSGATDFGPAFAAMRQEIIAQQLASSNPNYGTNTVAIGFQPGARYRTTQSLPLHSLPNNGLKVYGYGAAICADYTAGKAVVDMLGSRAITIRDLTIESKATNRPSVGILIGRHNGDTAGYHYLDNVYVDGWFGIGMYNYCSEQMRMEKTRIYAYECPALWMDVRNEIDVSQYSAATVTQTVGQEASFNNAYANHCEIRTLGAGSSLGALRLTSTYNDETQFARWWNFQNCYVTNNGPDGNTEKRPGIAIRGDFHRLALDIHCEPRGNATTIDLSHVVLFENTLCDCNLTQFKLHEHNSQAQRATIDCETNAQYKTVNIVGADIAVLNRDAGFGGVDAPLFGANCAVMSITGDVIVGDDPLLNDFTPLKRISGSIVSKANMTAVKINSNDSVMVTSANQQNAQVLSRLQYNTEGGTVDVTGYDIIKLVSPVTTVTLSATGGTGRRIVTILNARSTAITISNTVGGALTLHANGITNILILDGLFYAIR